MFINWKTQYFYDIIYPQTDLESEYNPRRLSPTDWEAFSSIYMEM